MALFKIEKGLAKNLENQRPTTHSGWCYFTIDDGKFYIDVADSSSVTLAKSNNDSTANRIPINAFYADRVSFTPRIKYIHNDSGELDLQIVMGEKYDSATGKVVENSSGYLEFPAADSENYGIVSTKEQVFSGAKTFLASPVFTQGIKLKGVGTNGADSFILSQQAETTTNKGDLYFFTSGINNLYHNSSDNQILTQKNYSSLLTLPIVHQQTMQYGVQTAQKPAFGETFDIPYLTVDKHGRVTGGNTITVTVPNATASTTANGLMTSAMVTKLNGIETGAQKNQNAFAKVAVGDTNIAAAAVQDTVKFVGKNLKVSASTSDKTVTYELTLGNIQEAIGGTPATETYVGNEITKAVNNLVDGAPDALNTLNELAAALGDNSNYASTIVDELSKKVAKAGDTMTGTLTLSNTTAALAVNGPATFGAKTSFNGVVDFSDDITTAGNIIPTSTAAKLNLGSSSSKWDTVYAATFSGKATSAGTADKVVNALTINGKTYDGSEAIDVGTIAVNKGGTGKTSWTKNALVYASDTTTLASMPVGTAGYILTSKASTTAPSWTDPATITVGSATSADTLTTARSISLVGAATGSTSFDGSKNVKLEVTGAFATARAQAKASGYHKIKINSANNWMTAFTVRLYQAYKYTDIVISGYNYGNDFWYSPAATILGSSTNTGVSVYFGHDSVSNLWIMIPAGDYYGVSIIDVTNGYAAFDALEDLFTISLESALPDASYIDETIVAYRPWYRNETVSMASALDSGKVGNAINPVYFSSSGVPVACAETKDSSSASAISTGQALVTERDIYYGLPTINNSHSYTSNTKIYAPSTGGTAGYILKANGTTSTPEWTQYVPVASGGTGIGSWTANRIVYSSGTTTLANAKNMYISDSQLGINVTAAPSTGIALQVGGNVASNADNTYTLGTDGYKWKTVYATTFSGNATSADKVNHTFTVNGVEFDGHEAKDAGTISTTYGGTGNTSYTANHLIWSSSATKLEGSSGIWTNGSSLVIGTTTAPISYTDYSLRVEGKTKLGTTTYFGDTYSIVNGAFAGQYTFNEKLTLKSTLTVQGTTTAYSINPAKTDTYSLGTSSALWKEIHATNLYGNGANITALNAGEITTGTLNAARLPSKEAWATTYGEKSAQTPGFGSTFDIPYITTDKYGRVTGGNTITVTIPSSTASTSANGLMTKDMVTKLNGIAAGAEVNQNAYGKISDGTNTITAAQEQETITFKGSHLKVDVLNNTVTYELTQGNIQDLIGETMTKTEISNAISVAINDLIDGAPDTLDTLNKIAAALNKDPDTVKVIIEDLGKKVDKAGDTMTGTLTLTDSTSALGVTGPASFKSTVAFDGTTSFSDTITAAGNIVPNVNNSVNIGSSSKKWATIYATTFSGKATSADAADVATKVSNSLTINGLTYDGSAAKNVGTIGVAYGGTGKTEWTANRIIYSSGKTTLANATNMYISNTQLGVNVTTAPSTGIALQVGGNIAANADNTYTLGTDGYKWATVYATTFSGNATSADKVNHKFTVNGVDFDGSSDQDAGVITTAHGGTGNDTYTADQLIYSSAADKLSGAAGLWSNGSALAVGATSSTYLAALEAYAFSVAGTSQFDGATYISSTGALIVQNTATNTSSTATADQFAVQIDGGVYIAKNLRVKSTAYFTTVDASTVYANGAYLGSRDNVYIQGYSTTSSATSRFDIRVYRQKVNSSNSGSTTYAKSSYYERYYISTSSTAASSSSGEAVSYKILTSKTDVAVSEGGTGKSSWTANRLIYSSETAKLANTASIYVNDTQLGINVTAVASDITLKVGGNTSTSGYIAPDADNTYTSGTADYKWSTVYATTFSGNATSADKVNNTFKVNGIEFDGHEAKDAGVIETQYGGTGNDTYVANHLIWSSSATKLDDSAGIWTDGSRLALGNTTNPNVFGTYTLHVNGASYSGGTHTVSGAFTASSTASFEGIAYAENTTDITAGTDKTGGFQVYGGMTVSKHLQAYGKIYIPSSGVAWRGGGVASNASIAITTTQTTGSYHPYFYTKTSSGNVFNLGGLGDNVGFYGYTSDQVAANVEGSDSTSWSTVWNTSTGQISHNKKLYISCADDSSSTTTGAVIVAGGVGISKQLRVGTTLTVTGAATLSSSLSVVGDFSTTGTSTLYHANPAKDSTYNLGTNTKRWANIYADTFHGTFGHDGSITKNLKLTTSWMDTGILGNTTMTNAASNTAAALTTGSYVIQVYTNATAEGYDQEYYTGVMSWYSGTCNDSSEPYYDEIVLHGNGHAKTKNLYLRTARQSSSAYMKLQICSDVAWSAAADIKFTFKRII